MSKVAAIKAEARKHSSNKRIVMALTSYWFHLSHFPTDYAGAADEAAHDLELSDEVEFKSALKAMVWGYTRSRCVCYREMGVAD